MENESEKTDLREINYFLGVEIHQLDVGILISQRKSTLEILKKFYIEKCKFLTTPLVVNEKLSNNDANSKAKDSMCGSLIGSLLYFAISSN